MSNIDNSLVKMVSNRLIILSAWLLSLEVSCKAVSSVNITPGLNQSAFYCDMCCLTATDKICNQHTMCIYSSRGHGPMCQGYRGMRLTEKEKQEVLNAHNELRNYVALGLETRGARGAQPPAADMREMQWDDELEAVASRWADQCVGGSDKCRDVARYPVGQNTAEGSFTELNLTTHVVKWYAQVLAFDASMVKNYQPAGRGMPQYSAYSQLVWADTYTLGCARVMYHSDSTLLYYKEHLTCNYGPAGNVAHNHVYRVGEACSACPEGLRCSSPRFNGLCYHANRAHLDEQCLLKEGGCSREFLVEETRLAERKLGLHAKDDTSCLHLSPNTHFVTILVMIKVSFSFFGLL